MRELKDQLNSVEIKIEAAPGPDLMGMIDEIRAQYEKLAGEFLNVLFTSWIILRGYITRRLLQGSRDRYNQ